MSCVREKVCSTSLINWQWVPLLRLSAGPLLPTLSLRLDREPFRPSRLGHWRERISDHFHRRFLPTGPPASSTNIEWQQKKRRWHLSFTLGSSLSTSSVIASKPTARGYAGCPQFGVPLSYLLNLFYFTLPCRPAVSSPHHYWHFPSLHFLE